MNQIKLINLEIKDGFLVKDGVKLTDISDKYYETVYGTNRPISDMPPTKVKSATIWTEVDGISDEDIGEDIGAYVEEFGYEPKKHSEILHMNRLKAISQDKTAYATDIEI